MSIARNSLGKCHWLHLCSLAAFHAVSYSESCIKGHRSSSCHHSDRPLFEIKKKGRPVSQCEKCRELRQSKKIHSKCTCNPKPDSANRGEVLASTTPKCTQLSTVSGLYIRNSWSALQLADSYQLFLLCRMDSEMYLPQHKYRVFAQTLDNEVFSLSISPNWFISLISSPVDALLNPCRCKSVWKCNCQQALLSTDKSSSESSGDLAILAHAATMSCCNTS